MPFKPVCSSSCKVIELASSLQEYYDAGMATVWDKPVITALANRMHSIDEMEEISSLIADINMDGDLYIDLIDDDLGDLSVLSQL